MNIFSALKRIFIRLFGRNFQNKRNTDGKEGYENDDDDVTADCSRCIACETAATTTDEALDRIVEIYVTNNMIDIPLIPTFMERRIYKIALKMCVDILHSKLLPRGRDKRDGSSPILGHDLSFTISPQTIYDSVKNTRATLMMDEDEERHNYCMSWINAFVESFIRNEKIQIFGIPDFLERTLYTNILKIVFGVVHDTLHTSKVRFMGHEISFRLLSLPPPQTLESSKSSKTGKNDDYDEHEEKRRLEKRKKEKNVLKVFRGKNAKDMNETDDTEKIIEELVEEVLRTDNMLLVPDSIERRIYSKAFKMMLAVMTEILQSCEISVLNHSITCDLTPSV